MPRNERVDQMCTRAIVMAATLHWDRRKLPGRTERRQDCVACPRKFRLRRLSKKIPFKKIPSLTLAARHSAGPRPSTGRVPAGIRKDMHSRLDRQPLKQEGSVSH